MRMWVHRLSIGASGAPKGAIDYSGVQDDLLEVARAIRLEPPELDGDYSAAETYLRTELFDRRTLRQGWGAPGMDVRRERRFKNSYVIALRRYWRSFPDDILDELRRAEGEPYKLFEALQPLYEEASGRLHIVQRMNEMSVGDIVFVPNVPEPSRTFTVVRVRTPYDFEERDTTAARFAWEVDFSHRRGVDDVRSFRYAQDTLQAQAFGPPYRRAIELVRSREEQFREFVRRHYAG